MLVPIPTHKRNLESGFWVRFFLRGTPGLVLGQVPKIIPNSGLVNIMNANDGCMCNLICLNAFFPFPVFYFSCVGVGFRVLGL